MAPLISGKSRLVKYDNLAGPLVSLKAGQKKKLMNLKGNMWPAGGWLSSHDDASEKNKRNFLVSFEWWFFFPRKSLILDLSDFFSLEILQFILLRSWFLSLGFGHVMT